MHATLSEQYKPCDCDSCKNVRLNLADNPKKKTSFKTVLNNAEKAFKKIFETQQYKPEQLFEIDEYKELVQATAETFNQAIPHEVSNELRSYLEQDVFVFSALKTHSQLTEARSYLKNKNGITPYHEFEQKVLKLNKKYNRHYLEAEYEFAVQSAQSADQWNNFSDNEDRYWLQKRTAKDDRVRASHLALEGITLPKSDPFWDKYAGALGWRCRCGEVEVLARDYQKSDSKKSILKGEKATTSLTKNGKNKLAMFRFNPGKNKKVFPPKNSYTKVKGANIVLTIINSPAIKSYKNGGYIKQSNLVDANSNDYDRVYNSCNYFAKKGHKTEIMPVVHRNSEMYQTYYKPLIGTKYEGKCPDIQIDGKFYEHEGFSTNEPKKALKNMLNRGLKQSDRVIIDDCGVSDRYLFNNIQARIKQGQNIKEVWILKEKEVELVYKKTEAN